MAKLEDKISDLQIAQNKTHVLLDSLTERVGSYIDVDNERYQDLMKFRMETTKHLAEVAITLKSMKNDVDTVVKSSVPALQKDNESTKATLKTHSWLIRAILGATLIAILGGTVTSLATCDFKESQKESEAQVEAVGN